MGSGGGEVGKGEGMGKKGRGTGGEEREGEVAPPF